MKRLIVAVEVMLNKTLEFEENLILITEAIYE